MLEIRSMREGDIDACAQIMAENELWQRYNVTFESARQRLQTGYEMNADILVADQDGSIAGFVWYVTRGVFQRSGYIMIIGVNPHLQSQGVGAKILRAAEEIMAASVADVFLLVSDFNQRAQTFYKRNGYVYIGSLPDYVLPGICELIFQKKIG